MTDIDEFINFKKERGVKDGTLEHYRWVIISVTKRAKEQGINGDPRTMTESDFRRIILGMNLTSNSINTTAAVFKMYLKFVGNPLDVKFLTNRESPNAKWISEDDFVRLFSQCDDPTTKIILHLGGNYGLRRKEICTLMMTDIKDGFFKVCGKGHGNGKVREVPLIKDDPFIKEYMKWRTDIVGMANKDKGEGRLVVSFHRKIISKLEPHSLFERMKKFFRDNGVDASPHSLRREFVTSAYRAGVDLVTIQRLVGHTSPQTTEHYIQNDKNTVIQAINQRNLYILAKTSV